MKYDIPADLSFEGERFLFRATIPEDYEQMRALLSDPKTMEYLLYMSHIDEGGWTLEQVQERVDTWEEGRKKGSDMHFSIIEKSTGLVAGSAGLKNLNATHKWGEFGAIVHHPFWGKGAFTEFLLCTGDYCFETLGLHRIEAATFGTNVRSRKALENLGFQPEGIKREAFYSGGKFEDDVLYGILESEWPDMKSKLLARQQRQLKS